MTDPVCLIGLDGATWDLLEPWIDDGELPTLESFLKRGAYGALHSTVPSNTPVALPALYTGCSPSKTGSFNFTRAEGTPVRLQEIEGPKLWGVLGEFDRRSCVVNVRTTHPPDSIDGVMISGPPTPGEDCRNSHPPGTADEVAYYPEAATDESRFHSDPYARSDEMVETFSTGLQRRFESFTSLLAADEFDFRMFWIGRTDSLQHWLWNDETSLLGFYKEVDSLIGRFLSETSGDVFVVSDHGFESMASRRFHVNEWLRRNGHLSVYGGAVGNAVLSTGQAVVRAHVPGHTLKRLLSTPGRHRDDTNSRAVIDRSRTNIPGITAASDAVLSTKWGIDVHETGAEREQICGDIVRGLSDLEDDAGRDVVRFVARRGDVYDEGPYLDDIPDVVFQLHQPYLAEAELSRTLFSEMGPSAAVQRSGHRFDGWHAYDPEGVWMAQGPRIASGERENLHITDVAPTLLHMLGVPVPEQMSGDVTQSIFDENASLRNEPVERLRREWRQSESDVSDAEMEQVHEQLRDMGYR
jgi:predicted AlkP superfamily phosphohydrolase/phosphomutase